MIEKYPDFIAQDTERQNWTDERLGLWSDAVAAFDDGDLEPLAAYLRAGYVIDGEIANRLLWAIEGEHWPVRLEARRTNKDRTAHSVRQARYYRDLEIGIWIETRLRANAQLKRADAITDGAKEFAVGKTLAAKALAMVQNQLAGNYGGYEFADLVTLSAAFPDDDVENPRPKRRVRTKQGETN